MYGIRLLRLFAFLLAFLLCSGQATPLLAAEDVIELSGGCTLYDAIIAANTDTESGACPAGRGADTIRLTADVSLERELPPIVSTLSIEGEGYTISGDDAYHIFHVDNDGVLSIREITLTRGFAERGGAILNQGVVSIYSSQLNGNFAKHGGAISNSSGKLVVESSTFHGNSAWVGGAIANRWEALIRSSLFTGNESASGAAINNGGDMQITKSTLSSNRGSFGGAIENTGWLTIEQSSLNDNSSDQTAGILNDGPTSRLVVSNSTISGNRSGSYGGGISAFGTAILTHVTIVKNESAEGGGIFRTKQGEGLVVLRNSIIAGNGGGDCTVGLHEQVNSIIGDGSCDARMQGEPLLEEVGALYVPAVGSPAIAAGDALYCTLVDQFGNKRPRDEPCDIGAVEAPELASPSLPVQTPRPTATPEKCVFEDEIIAANTDAPYGACPAGDGADTIMLHGPVVLLDGVIQITSDITIEGNGHTIEYYYSAGSQLFEVLGGHLRIRNLTVRGGLNSWTGGAIAVLKGKLTMQNSTILGSSAAFGGAIFNDGGEVAVFDSRFNNNRATDLDTWDSGSGGAIYNYGDDGLVEITNSKFVSNMVAGMGGALANGSGQMRIDSSLFVHNFTTGLKRYPTHPGIGGAIASLDEIHIRNSTFVGNSAAMGGAIWFDHPKATLEHLTIVRNGGVGIYVLDHTVEGVVKIVNSLIAGNTVGRLLDFRVSSRSSLEQPWQPHPRWQLLPGHTQADPLLPAFDPMANTMTLQAGSPAIDAGDPEYCLPFDQLGTARPAGGGCDIGAH